MDETLLKELAEYVPLLERPDKFGITIAEFAAANHCSASRARAMLNKAVEDGVLAVHMMALPGRAAKAAVYHRPKDWPPKESR